MGYRRENGRVATRNHVIILPMDDISNTACEGVASLLKGVIAIPHPYGRNQFGEDLELYFRTLIGTGANPNVAAAIIIGSEPEWTNRIVDGIAKTGKPVKGFYIKPSGGDINTIAKATRQAIEYVIWASELQRTECSLDELYVSVKCGESDTTSGIGANPTVGSVVDRLVEIGATVSFGETTEITGAELDCKARAATHEVGEEFMRAWKAYDDIINRYKTDDLSGSQPDMGNIQGGLTTIEEKAFGNLKKIGKKSRYVGVLKPAEAPRGKGLWFMDSSSAGAEAVTLWGASGAVVHLFPTGQGNVLGHPILPVIKLCANYHTCQTMSEHIDLDVSALLKGEMTIEEAGDKLLEMMIRVCNGRLTAAEVLGHREFILTKLYVSS